MIHEKKFITNINNVTYARCEIDKSELNSLLYLTDEHYSPPIERIMLDPNKNKMAMQHELMFCQCLWKARTVL